MCFEAAIFVSLGFCSECRRLTGLPRNSAAGPRDSGLKQALYNQRNRCLPLFSPAARTMLLWNSEGPLFDGESSEASGWWNARTNRLGLGPPPLSFIIVGWRNSAIQRALPEWFADRRNDFDGTGN